MENFLEVKSVMASGGWARWWGAGRWGQSILLELEDTNPNIGDNISDIPVIPNMVEHTSSAWSVGMREQ